MGGTKPKIFPVTFMGRTLGSPGMKVSSLKMPDPVELIVLTQQLAQLAACKTRRGEPGGLKGHGRLIVPKMLPSTTATGRA